MKAMLLAAGRGERMMPLTASCPKPLLTVDGKPLLAHHIERLSAIGITELVINHSYLGEQIEAYFGDGHAWGVAIHWSREVVPLETAGGIIQALPLLGDAPFIVVNGDIWCDFPLDKWLQRPQLTRLDPSESLAHLLLVDNPPHNPQGDFALDAGRLSNCSDQRLTFAGVGLYHPGLFADQPKDQPLPLGPILRQYAALGRISGEHYRGDWLDVGTPQRLEQLRQHLQQQT